MNALSVAGAARVATLTIDQPDGKVNVLSRAMWSELEETVRTLGQRSDFDGLAIVSAKPGVFIAGADLRELADVPGPDHAPTRQFIERGLRVLDALESLPYPTVACIDGAALGGGLEVALACDVRLAGTNPKTKFGLPEVSLGLIPGWGGTQRLPRIVGPTSAIEMLLQNLQLDAEAARHRGLVSRIVPSENLRAEAAATLRDLQRTGGWKRQRDIKRQPLDVDGSELTIEDMSAGKISEPKLNAMSLSPEALETFRDFACRQMKDRLTCNAASAAVDVVASGCVLPLPDALRLETDTFVRLAGRPEARTLIAAFFASRKK
jgi:enoyl-CoA hydratase/carnithine racemase